MSLHDPAFTAEEQSSLSTMNKSVAQVVAHIYSAAYFKLQLPLPASFPTLRSLVPWLVWILVLKDVPAVLFLWHCAEIQKFF